jgi:hypothetical protein
MLEAKDAAGLVGLSTHADRSVRKAVRKALHKLRSAGVAIPEDAPRNWSPGGIVQELRGGVEAVALIDTHGLPGASRFMLVEPDEKEGGRLFVAVVSADDRVLDFRVYGQTDGQQARLRREWARLSGGRTVPPSWVRQRLRWAREQTVAGGFSVPPALDEVLAELGEPVSERPPAFLAGETGDSSDFDAEQMGSVVAELGSPLWPPLFDMDELVQRVAEVHGGDGAKDQEQHLEAVRQAAAEDDDVAEGLGGPVANLIEDAGITLWLEHKDDVAHVAIGVAEALRAAERPQSLPWVGPLLVSQIASFVRQLLAASGETPDEETPDEV